MVKRKATTTRHSENVVIAAFTEDQVTRLTGISKRQLRYWDTDGFFVPSLAYEDRSRPYSRLYSFRDVASLRVVNQLRNNSRVSLQHLRETKDKLLRLGEDVWTHTVLYVLNRRVVFKNPETDNMEEVVSGQCVLQIPLKIVSEGVREAIAAMRARDADKVGKIERKRGVNHNRPVIAGTRIPVSSIQAFYDAGYTVERILKEYPTLSSDDVRAAISYRVAA